MHPKTKVEEQDELSSLLQVPLVVSEGTSSRKDFVRGGCPGCKHSSATLPFIVRPLELTHPLFGAPPTCPTHYHSEANLDNQGSG